jgi:hypothetical protein
MKSSILGLSGALLVMAAGLFLAGNGSAQTATQSTAQNHPGPVCKPITVDLGALPAGVDFTGVNIDPLKSGACSDAAGDPLTLVATAAVPQISQAKEAVVKHTWKAGQSTTLTYSVTDGFGNTATSTITIKRD